MFLRQTAVGREPLAVAMSGVRMGERLLQIGADDAAIAAALAARPGLSGDSAILVADDRAVDTVRRSVAETGALVNIQVATPDVLPFPDGSFDAVVIHNRRGLPSMQSPENALRLLAECHRVLREGGRVVVLERGTRAGLTALLRPRADRPGQPATDVTQQNLGAAGFRAVRLLADRDKYRFIEGLKT